MKLPVSVITDIEKFGANKLPKKDVKIIDNLEHRGQQLNSVPKSAQIGA